MPTVQIQADGKTVSVAVASSCLLEEAIMRAGFSLPRPCAGNHTCGRCRVRVSGAVSAPDDLEKELLKAQPPEEDMRLACCAKVLGDCQVELPAAQQVKVRLFGLGATFSGPPSFAGGWTLAADIGTTTVAAYLIDPSGRAQTAQPLQAILRGAAGAPNAQAVYGADVLSRIQSATEQGVRPLQKVILAQLDELFDGLLRGKSLPPGAIKGVVLTGNTTMLHLAAGLNPAGLGVYPFTPESLFGVKYASWSLLRRLPSMAEIYFTPCVGAYVGGDLVSAAVACSLAPGEMLLDVGTNGEMALMTKKGMLCCSTAAGPAFEGVNLSCGMNAGPGAICDVSVADGGLCVKTVEDAPPAGICGAGAISALAALRRLGWVDETGRLAESFQPSGVALAAGVFLNQADIRQLQLAKGAIAAGLDTLLHYADQSPEEIGTLYLAGGFGAVIDPRAAAAIGLFPAALADRVRPAGNAAGMGACACACWQSAIDQAERLAKSAREIALSTDSFFNERFIENMGL